MLRRIVGAIVVVWGGTIVVNRLMYLLPGIEDAYAHELNRSWVINAIINVIVSALMVFIGLYFLLKGGGGAPGHHDTAPQKARAAETNKLERLLPPRRGLNAALLISIVTSTAFLFIRDILAGLVTGNINGIMPSLDIAVIAITAVLLNKYKISYFSLTISAIYSMLVLFASASHIGSLLFGISMMFASGKIAMSLGIVLLTVVHIAVHCQILGYARQCWKMFDQVGRTRSIPWYERPVEAVAAAIGIYLAMVLAYAMVALQYEKAGRANSYEEGRKSLEKQRKQLEAGSHLEKQKQEEALRSKLSSPESLLTFNETLKDGEETAISEYIQSHDIPPDVMLELAKRFGRSDDSQAVVKSLAEKPDVSIECLQTIYENVSFPWLRGARFDGERGEVIKAIVAHHLPTAMLDQMVNSPNRAIRIIVFEHARLSDKQQMSYVQRVIDSGDVEEQSAIAKSSATSVHILSKLSSVPNLSLNVIDALIGNEHTPTNALKKFTDQRYGQRVNEAAAVALKKRGISS